ncbi:MAG: hypothetical protein QM644_03255 [Mobilitalea sp.]
MKKKMLTVVLIGCLGLYTVGCGTKESNTETDNKPNKEVDVVTSEEPDKESQQEIIPTESANAEVSSAQESETENSNQGSNQTVAVASAAADIDMVSLPEGIKGVKAESVPNVELQQLIIDYYEIPEDFYETTSYDYNYVDLDGDGTDEIFAVVIGPYTSGSGGSSALWVIESAGKLHVNQNFTLVNTPVIISDTVTNGLKELMIPYYGGGAESSYSVLVGKDGLYPRVPDGKMIKALDGITGTAIIANDKIKEMEAGIMRLNLLSEETEK